MKNRPENCKTFSSPQYNYVFNKKTGLFIRWGASPSQNPIYSQYGPELLDIEISSGGDCKGNCPFCYKANGGNQKTHNMTLDTFKIILSKMPETLVQIAFGIMDLYTNPDFLPMLMHCKEQGVVPNYTTHGLDLDENILNTTAQCCGAVAVSVVDKNATYNAVDLYSSWGVGQVNIHYVLSEQTLPDAFEILDDIKNDDRLKNLNSIVFLQYKPKGRNSNQYLPVTSVDSYRKLISVCDGYNISYGFDSCSAPVFNEATDGKYEEIVEPCEAALFSAYINCYGQFYPCSFCENERGWESGLSVIGCDDFMKDVWEHEKTKTYRLKLIEACRVCPINWEIQK